LAKRKKIYKTMPLDPEIIKNLREVAEKTGIRMNFQVEKALTEYWAKHRMLEDDGGTPD